VPEETGTGTCRVMVWPSPGWVLLVVQTRRSRLRWTLYSKPETVSHWIAGCPFWSLIQVRGGELWAERKSEKRKANPMSVAKMERESVRA